MKFGFKKNYLMLFSLLFVIEVFIALFVNDNFILPYLGDYLVVILIYCFDMNFVNRDKYKIAFGVLIFAFAVEFLQYIDFITIVGLQNNKLAQTVIGTSFSFEDGLLYFFSLFNNYFYREIFIKF